MIYAPTYCPGSQCDPCKPKPVAGTLYIEGSTWLTFSQSAGGDGKSYQCQAVYRIVGIPENYNVNAPLTGTVKITWHAYSVETPDSPSAPIAGTFELTSIGHYGGWYGEFPPVQYTLLPKTYLGAEIDIGHGVYTDPPELTEGTLWTGQEPPWTDWLLTPLATPVKIEQLS